MTELADGSYRAHNAVVTGDVSVGRLTSLWFNVVVRGDVARILIGQQVNVQDNAVIHCDADIESIIQDDVTIGHAALVHGQFVGRGTLIGMGAVLLSRTRIGSECVIAAGALLPPDLHVPDRMMVIGAPGRITRLVTDQEIQHMRQVTQRCVELAQQYAHRPAGPA